MLSPELVTNNGITEVLIDSAAATDFLGAAAHIYDQVTATSPYPCFAVLAGRITANSAHVVRAYLTKNVRRTSNVALAEFDEFVVPYFGEAYRNTHRGFWCDSFDLLRAHRAAEADNLDLLGSIHMHPDFHRFQPRAARTARLSERPTPMDEYMFRNTGWPVNVICYFERNRDRLYHTWSAWTPDEAGLRYVPVATRVEIDSRFETVASR